MVLPNSLNSCLGFARLQRANRTSANLHGNCGIMMAREMPRMMKFALAAWMFVAAQGLFAQSIVFVSPSTKGATTISSAEASLGSFEEANYLAAAHYLAEHLCTQPRIDGAVG